MRPQESVILRYFSLVHCGALMGVSRASFASAEETRESTEMMIGGVTELALPEGLGIYADLRLL